MGDTATRWEGDTLVLETISFDTRPWIQGGGCKTEQTKITERLAALEKLPRIPSTPVEDPNVDETWTSTWRKSFRFRPPMRT